MNPCRSEAFRLFDPPDTVGRQLRDFRSTLDHGVRVRFYRYSEVRRNGNSKDFALAFQEFIENQSVKEHVGIPYVFFYSFTYKKKKKRYHFKHIPTVSDL